MAERVTLRGGLTVDARALVLLWELEEAGASLQEQTPGMLRVVARPGAVVAPELRETLRPWKLHLLALVRYDPARY